LTLAREDILVYVRDPCLTTRVRYVAAPLTESEQAEARRKLESVGRWLREEEPAQSLEEDLLGHQMRSLLVALGVAVNRRDRRKTKRRIAAIEACVTKLYAARQRRRL
jgi:hypothetical protein